MQTQGKEGVQILKDRIKAYGVGTLWYGAWATAAASFVGSFPWFATVRSPLVPSLLVPFHAFEQRAPTRTEWQLTPSIAVQLPLRSPSPSALASPEARAPGSHRLHSVRRLGYHLQLATSPQDVPPSEPDQDQLPCVPTTPPRILPPPSVPTAPHETDPRFFLAGEAARKIIHDEGLLGLFGRGLGTRILANGLQGLMFSVLWKFFQDWLAGK